MNVEDRVLDLLVSRGMLSPDQLQIVEVERRIRPAPLGKALVSLGLLSEATLRDATAEALDQRSVDLGSVVPDPDAIARLPRALASRHHVFPISFQAETNTLILAMADPLNILALDQIRTLVGAHVTLVPLLASESDIMHAIAQFYGLDLSLEGILQELETDRIEEAGLASREGAYHHPTIRLVDALLAEAVKQGASDIHFEPEWGFVRVRYRIDGVLRQVRGLHSKYWPAIVVRVKVMGHLNIADTRSPQDGRITLVLLGRAVDFRIAVLPTLHGENIVIRILDRHRGILSLDQLGLSEKARRNFDLIAARPEGLVLVTGPTGSGKTTTLYALLRTLPSDKINVMTLEDPVEYPLPGIRQTAINEAVRLNFASGVRAVLRQDPDVILIGEIRDPETASMALRAAMTGHQVYATLHANSALGAIPRLADLGLRAEILAGNLIGVVAQRLVRKLCPHCRALADVPLTMTTAADLGPGPHWRAVGCAHCDHQGYRGRIALMELIVVDEGLDALIAEGAPPHRLRMYVQQRGAASLVEDALRRVRQGETTLEEVMRVVDLRSVREH